MSHKYKSVDDLADEFYKSMPGDTEPYDTLDDIILAKDTVEELYSKLACGLKGAVGVAVAGQNTLSNPNDGYWGRPLTLSTGEHLQMRILPRGTFGQPLDHSDFRLVATRRTFKTAVAEVGFAIFYMPRESFIVDNTTPLTCASTIGCRGVHVLLPSLISKHDPHRSKEDACGVSMDPRGFHSVRPSSFHLPMATAMKNHTNSFALTAGDSYLVFAGHMAGVDIPDPLRRCADVMTNNEHSRHISAKQRRIIQSIGEADTHAYIFSALTLCELLSAEGLLGILCNQFFWGAMPDTFYSPVGLPLSLCMAIHLALYPNRFGLPKCTKCDAFSNAEVVHAFHSKWKRLLLDGYRAIDCAVKSAYDRAFAQAQITKGMDIQLVDSMTLWQRIGQRMITKIMSDPRDELRRTPGDPVFTRFGVAELVTDVISETKYDILARKGFCRSVVETPIDKIFLAPRCDLRTTAYRLLDSVEAWLRTGMFGDIRLSEENVNIAPVETVRGTRLPCKLCGTCFKCNCPQPAGKAPEKHEYCTMTGPSGESSAEKTADKNAAAASLLEESDDSDESDDADDLMDRKLCVKAMETAAGALTLSLIHGPFSMHDFGIKCFLVGSGCKNKCADCDEEVDACQALLFGSKTDACRHCNRYRCFKCSAKHGDDQPHCLRCDPKAPRVRQPMVHSPTKGKKSAKK